MGYGIGRRRTANNRLLRGNLCGHAHLIFHFKQYKQNVHSNNTLDINAEQRNLFSLSFTAITLIARFMGPTWAHLGPTGWGGGWGGGGGGGGGVGVCVGVCVWGGGGGGGGGGLGVGVGGWTRTGLLSASKTYLPTALITGNHGHVWC